MCIYIYIYSTYICPSSQVTAIASFLFFLPTYRLFSTQQIFQNPQWRIRVLTADSEALCDPAFPSSLMLPLQFCSIHTLGMLPASLTAFALASPSGKLFPQVFTMDSLTSFKSAQISPFQWGLSWPLLFTIWFPFLVLFSPPWHLSASNMLYTVCTYYLYCLSPVSLL